LFCLYVGCVCLSSKALCVWSILLICMFDLSAVLPLSGVMRSSSRLSSVVLFELLGLVSTTWLV